MNDKIILLAVRMLELSTRYAIAKRAQERLIDRELEN